MSSEWPAPLSSIPSSTGASDRPLSVPLQEFAQLQSLQRSYGPIAYEPPALERPDFSVAPEPPQGVQAIAQPPQPFDTAAYQSQPVQPPQPTYLASSYEPLVTPIEYSFRETRTQGYLEQPPGLRPMVGEMQHVLSEDRWNIGDDAPRYAPPGSHEDESDPFGLGALPRHHTYQGPREVPRDATMGLVAGLLALVFFPCALYGFPLSRRAKALTEAAPNRYSGKAIAMLGLVLNAISPLVSGALAWKFLRK